MRAILLLITLPLLAHDTYVMPQKFRTAPGETIVVSVHNGDSFPVSEDAVDPRRVTVRTPQGAIESLNSMNRATHGVWQVDRAGSLFIAAETQPRVIELAPAKFESYLKEEGLDAAIAWRAQHSESAKPGREMYSKAAKSLVVSGAADSGWKKPLGLNLEFVPLNDPTQLAPGGKLRFQLLFQGKPLAGVQVEKAWASATGNGARIAGRTGEDGVIEIPFEHAGKWRLHAVSMVRCAEPEKADWRSYWASFTFEVAGTMTSLAR